MRGGRLFLTPPSEGISLNEFMRNLEFRLPDMEAECGPDASKYYKSSWPRDSRSDRRARSPEDDSDYSSRRRWLTVLVTSTNPRYILTTDGFWRSIPTEDKSKCTWLQWDTRTKQHVQRQGDLILEAHWDYARAYIDDFVIFSNTFEEHCEHLQKVFSCLDEYNVSLAPKKAYVGYPSVQLLGQRVDVFGYASTTKRMAALQELKYPCNALELEIYLGAVGYLCKMTPYLAQLLNPLQDLKTAYFRTAPKKKGTSR